MKNYIVLIALLFVASIKLQATNYFINGNTGNNSNDGRTVATAKKDFTFCDAKPNALSPGDTVFIMNGTYLSPNNSPVLRLAFIGTASKPIVFTNFPNHKPVLKYTGTPHALIALNWGVKTEHVVINGLKLEGNNLANPFEETLARAKNQTNNCLNNTVGQPTNAEFNVDGFGIYDNGTGCAHITISNCDISNFPGGGIATGGLDYITIENCKIYNNGWFAVDGNSGISILKCKNYDNHTAGGFSINIRNNTVYNNINYIPWNGVCKFSDGNGIIIDLLQENNYSGKVVVENNVCYDNGGAGIQYFKSSNGVIRNNTLYKNGKQDGLPGFQGYRSGEFSMYNSTNVAFYNNIVFPIPGKVAVTSGAIDPTKVSGNNLIVSTTSGGFTFSSTDILNQDPQFVDALNGNFRIKCTSPALNAGSNTTGQYSPFDIAGAKRPIGTKPDIGAYEANCTTPCSALITSPNSSFCAGGSVILTANTGVSYKWFNGTTQVGAAATYRATTAGSYTVEVTNANGCKATSAAKVITVNPLPVITYNVNKNGTWSAANTATVCVGSSIIVGPWPVVASGWNWTGPNNFTATTREINLNNIQANQSGIYTTTYTDPNGCSATGTFNIQVNAIPAAAISSPSNSFCTGGSVALTASTGASYKWFNGTTQVGTTQTYTATAAGSYTVEVTNSSGCKATSPAKVITVNALPTTTITSPANAFCTGGSVVLTASTGTSYKWFNGATQVGTTQTYTATAAGSYTVEVTNASGCKATSPAKVITVTVSSIWYADTDNDGKGNPSVTISSCTKPAGYVAIAGDACPTDATKITPGNCGCNKTENSCLDCAGATNGTAIIDACGKCAGGTTGIPISTNPSQCVTTTVPSISGPLCVVTGANNNYLFNEGSLSIASINWWTNSGATVTQNTANTKQVLINFPAYANGTNATITAGVNLNAAPWYTEYTLLVKVGGCTGSTPQLRASATPLPFNALTTVSLHNNEIINSVRVVDMNGVEVFNQNNINKNSFELGAELPTGMYIAYVTSSKGISIVKLVKNN